MSDFLREAISTVYSRIPFSFVISLSYSQRELYRIYFYYTLQNIYQVELDNLSSLSSFLHKDYCGHPYNKLGFFPEYWSDTAKEIWGPDPKEQIKGVSKHIRNVKKEYRTVVRHYNRLRSAYYTKHQITITTEAMAGFFDLLFKYKYVVDNT